MRTRDALPGAFCTPRMNDAVRIDRQARQLGPPGGLRRAAQHDMAVQFPPGQRPLVAIAQQHHILPVRDRERAEIGKGTEVDHPPVAVGLAHQRGAEFHEIGPHLVGAHDIEAAAAVGIHIAPLEFLVQPRHGHALGHGILPLLVGKELQDAAVGLLFRHKQRAVRGDGNRPGLLERGGQPFFQRNLGGNGPARQIGRHRPAGRQRRLGRPPAFRTLIWPLPLFRNIDVARDGMDGHAHAAPATPRPAREP